MEYRIVTNRQSDYLTREVYKLLREGWELVGGLAVDDGMYAQAMSKISRAGTVGRIGDLHKTDQSSVAHSTIGAEWAEKCIRVTDGVIVMGLPDSLPVILRSDSKGDALGDALKVLRAFFAPIIDAAVRSLKE